MFQRLLIMKAWEKAGLTTSRKKKVKDFIEFVNNNPQLGWEECGKEFCQKYDDVFGDLIPPLMDMENNLIILNLLRLFDPQKRRKDLNLLKKFAAQADARKSLPSLEAIARLKIPSLTKVLQERKDLPVKIRAILLKS